MAILGVFIDDVAYIHFFWRRHGGKGLSMGIGIGIVCGNVSTPIYIFLTWSGPNPN